MQSMKINCNDLMAVLNGTLVKLHLPDNHQHVGRNGTLSDTDPAGAVKFTIAVVLLYGVGVIGLLGITARRNRRVEMMDKEVNEFLKSRLYTRPVKRKSKPKRVISRLISALHSSSKTDDRILPPDVNTRRMLQRRNTWCAGMDVDSISKSDMVKTVSMSLFDGNDQNESSDLMSSEDLCLKHANTNKSQVCFRPSTLYQQPHSRSLGCIVEENDDECGGKEEGGANCIDVCDSTPMGKTPLRDEHVIINVDQSL